MMTNALEKFSGQESEPISELNKISEPDDGILNSGIEAKHLGIGAATGALLATRKLTNITKGIREARKKKIFTSEKKRLANIKAATTKAGAEFGNHTRNSMVTGAILGGGASYMSNNVDK